MVLCAILSASAKWLNMKKRERKKALTVEAVTATVAGVAIFLLYMAFNFDMYLGCFLSLAFGFLGVSGIEALFKHGIEQAAKKAGIPIDTAKDDKDGDKK